MTVSSLTIYAKFGRLFGSLSQERFINLTQGSGVLGGTGGLNYLFRTSSETLVPEIFL